MVGDMGYRGDGPGIPWWGTWDTGVGDMGNRGGRDVVCDVARGAASDADAAYAGISRSSGDEEEYKS